MHVAGSEAFGLFDLLAMLRVLDVVWRANNGVTIVAAAGVEARLFRSAHARPGALVNVCKVKKFSLLYRSVFLLSHNFVDVPWQVRLSAARR